MNASHWRGTGRVHALPNRCKEALKRFRFEDLTKEQFVALFLLSVLQSRRHEPPLSRILLKLNQDGDQVCFDDVNTDCIDFLPRKADYQVFAKDNVYVNPMQNPSHRLR
jgi:hypothetical protein